MERASRLARKCAIFSEALKGFETSLAIDTTAFDPVVADAIRNGRIQKFEYCTELCWKLVKEFLLVRRGIDTPAPKSVAKESFRVGIVDERGYEGFVAMIDDRNALSHLYLPAEFNRIHSALEAHLATMKQICEYVCGAE